MMLVSTSRPNRKIECTEGCSHQDQASGEAGNLFDQQLQSDLRWIREPFLFDETDHGFVVVHGHTIRSSVEVRPNRIGIDTGAYRTGVLTALAIEGNQSWLLDTRPAGEAVVSS